MVDDTPHILELIAVQEELGTILAAVIDRSHARFFLAGVGVATELEGLIDPARRGGSFHGDRQDAPGWGERDYHNRLREERHRHCAAIARHLQYLTRLHPTRGLMLAGPRRETTALEPFLSRELAGKIIGTTALNPTAVGAAEVQAAALAVADAHQRQTELGLVASLAESIGTGWAVDGPRETLRALARGQARTLLVRADFELPGFRCGTNGRLVVAAGDCRGDGTPSPVQDIVDEAVEEALGQGLDVVVVHDPAAAAAIDGLAAILRYR